MITLLLQIAFTFALLVGLMTLWYGMQSWVRRTVPGTGPDAMKGRWGCGGCAGGACGVETDNA